MRLDYDHDADAGYIRLREGVPGAFSVHLDFARHIDYGSDSLPIGVELLGVSQGVDLTDLPQRADIARLLADAQLPGWEGTNP